MALVFRRNGCAVLVVATCLGACRLFVDLDGRDDGSADAISAGESEREPLELYERIVEQTSEASG